MPPRSIAPSTTAWANCRGHERAAAAAEFTPGADLAACTVLGEDDLLIVRYRGGSAERARNFIQAGWQLLRPALLGRPAVAPRIWAT